MNVILSVILIIVGVLNVFIKSKDKYFILLFNIINSIGAITLVFTSNLSTLHISQNVLTDILLLYLIVNFAFFCVNFYKHDFLIKEEIIRSDRSFFGLFFLLTIPIVYFLILNYDKLPIYFIIKGINIVESQRPDVSGEISHYFSFTLFLVGIYLPFTINMLYKAHEQRKVKIKFLVLPLVLLPWIIMFDKSSLFEVVFFILVINPLFFKYYNRLSRKRTAIINSIVLVILLIILYNLTRFLYGSSSSINLSTMAKLVFGRVSLISTFILGKIIDIFMGTSTTLPEGETLRHFIFKILYSREVGGAPTSYIGTLVFYIRNRYLVYIATFVVSTIIFAFRRLVYQIENSKFKYAIFYLQYYGAIILSTTFLEDYLLRTLIPIAFFMIVDKFFITIKSKNNWFKKMKLER
ncbi:hypothetical protein IZY60_09630 [Lutibacter sp. B2]|nr:hypothetical protein [Lutibacter sp. B2]